MSLIKEYDVSIKNINEKTIISIEKIINFITIIINYKGIKFENIIDIRDDSTANTDCNNDKGMGISNIYSFIIYSLENNNTNIEFIHDKEYEIASFEITFNININDFIFGYKIDLDAYYK